MPINVSRNRSIAFSVLCIFGLLHLFIPVLNHYYYRTYALDYAVYNFAFFDYAHFRISPCPAYIYPFPATFLQDHFSLTLMVLSPLYWILGTVIGTYALLVIQAAFIITGAWFTYRLIEYRTNNYKLALCSMILYFVMYGHYSLYLADVNLAIIGSSFLPVFLYYFHLKKVWPAFLCFIFLLFNREDYALWFIFISLFLALLYRKDKFQLKLALILLSGSLAFFLITINFIIPALEDEHKKYMLFDFTVVGSSPREAFWFILKHPLRALELLFINHSDSNYYTGIKYEFYLVYIVSGGFILFTRPIFLIPLIPILAKKMYDDNPLRWSIETYYSVEFVSLMPVLIFLIISSYRNPKLKIGLAVSVCVFAAAISIYKLKVPPPNPIVGQTNKYTILSSGFYKPAVNVKEVNYVLSKIPKDAPVSASCRLLPHLAYREKVYYFSKIEDAQYVALLKKGDAYPLSDVDFETEMKKLYIDPKWKVLADTRDVVLFGRKE
jgi:uncharacterized membrane protein